MIREFCNLCLSFNNFYPMSIMPDRASSSDGMSHKIRDLSNDTCSTDVVSQLEKYFTKVT